MYNIISKQLESELFTLIIIRNEKLVNSIPGKFSPKINAQLTTCNYPKIRVIARCYAYILEENFPGNQ